VSQRLQPWPLILPHQKNTEFKKKLNICKISSKKTNIWDLRTARRKTIHRFACKFLILSEPLESLLWITIFSRKVYEIRTKTLMHVHYNDYSHRNEGPNFINLSWSLSHQPPVQILNHQLKSSWIFKSVVRIRTCSK